MLDVSYPAACCIFLPPLRTHRAPAPKPAFTSQCLVINRGPNTDLRHIYKHCDANSECNVSSNTLSSRRGFPDCDGDGCDGDGNDEDG